MHQSRLLMPAFGHTVSDISWIISSARIDQLLYAQESIVLNLPCCWSRYHMLRCGCLSKSFNGSIIERKTADTTIPWHGMSEGLGCVVFNSHTSTDYVLEGAELSASSDSWAGNWVCLGRAAWLCSETPLGPGLISVVLRLPPPTEALWPAVCSAPLGEWTGPCSRLMSTH